MTSTDCSHRLAARCAYPTDGSSSEQVEISHYLLNRGRLHKNGAPAALHEGKERFFAAGISFDANRDRDKPRSVLTIVSSFAFRQ